MEISVVGCGILILSSFKYSQKINIFSTTNTKHNKAFTEECFKNARRTGFKNLTVFQFDSVNNIFDKNYSILKS